MNGGGAASGASAAEGRGACILQAPPRGQKRGVSRAGEPGAERTPALPILRIDDRVEQLLPRERHGLAEVSELARPMTGEVPEVSGWRQSGRQRASARSRGIATEVSSLL